MAFYGGVSVCVSSRVGVRTSTFAPWRRLAANSRYSVAAIGPVELRRRSASRRFRWAFVGFTGFTVDVFSGPHVEYELGVVYGVPHPLSAVVV